MIWHSLFKLPLLGTFTLKSLFFQNEAFSKVLFGFAFPCTVPADFLRRAGGGAGSLEPFAYDHRFDAQSEPIGGVFVKRKETTCTRRGAHHQHPFGLVKRTFPFDVWGADFGTGLEAPVEFVAAAKDITTLRAIHYTSNCSSIFF